MTVIIILIAVSFGVACAFLAAFVWAVKTDQYNDTYTPSIRILQDDGFPTAGENNSNTK